MASEAYFVEIFTTSHIGLDHGEEVAVLIKRSACNMHEDSLKVSS